MDSEMLLEGKIITIKDLYPQLNEGQLRDAEYNLKRYFEICLEIYRTNAEKIEKRLKNII